MNAPGNQVNEQKVQGNEQQAQANEQVIQESEQGVRTTEQDMQENEPGVQERKQGVQANEQDVQSVMNEQGVQENEQGVQTNEQGIQAVIIEQGVQENEQGVQSEEDELEQETCVVCLESAEVNDLKLCQCNYRIHKECLKTMYLSYENYFDRDIRGMQCLECNTDIKLKIEPGKCILVKGMENLSHGYKWYCKKLYFCVNTIVIHQVLTIYGLIFLYKIYGKRFDGTLSKGFDDLDMSVVLCASIPFISIAVSFSAWEDTLLLFLRRCSRLPVVGCVFPREYPQVREPPRHRKCLGTIVDGMLLPLFAAASSRLVCGSMERGLPRLLLGAAAFLSLRGALYMYYRQSKYNLLANRSVANYQDPGRAG